MHRVDSATPEDSLNSPLTRPVLLGLIGLILLAVLSSITCLNNQFAQDDLAIILRDEGIHAFSLSRIFFEPYWPAPFIRDLYRPFASSLFAAEWWAGGGSPLTFRIVSITLYSSCTLACFALARRLLPFRYAWWIAALFAVHPVHVEAVAVAVNQGELIVALILVLATAWYIEQRMRGPLTWRQAIGIAVVTAVAALFKEHGVVLPALLVMVECLLLRDPPRLIDRLRQLRPTLLLCTLAVALLAWRRSFLFPDLKGSFTAEGLLGLNMLGRIYTMLQVVPRWIYLTIWPQHLQADYSPQVIMGAKTFGVVQAGGLVLLALLAWLGIRSYRKTPTVLFGLGFAAIAILPVSNILVATGIVMAERTLFMPSFGALIALGGIVHVAVGQRTFGRYPRLALEGLLEVLLVTGMIRSGLRHMIWHDPMTLALTTLQDAPLSYRAWYGLGALMIDNQHVPEGQQMIRNAIKLSPGSTPLYFSMADSYRNTGDCESALPYYKKGLALFEYVTPRSGMIACQIWLGQYQEARLEALNAMSGSSGFKIFKTWLRLADSAIRVGAPPKTVTLPVDSIPSITVRGEK